MSQGTIEKFFTDVWQLREETIYPRLFGSLKSEISVIPAEFFSIPPHEFKPPPLWLHYGAVTSPPDSIRNCWAYASSGLSNPTLDQCEHPNPAEPSGLGFEVVMFTPTESPWAVRVIQWAMANQMLVAAGLVSFELVEIFDRIHLPPALYPPDTSYIKHIFVVPAPADIHLFDLPSGKVEMLLLLGITDAEMKFARAQDGSGLLELLQHHGVSRVTDVTRQSVI